MSSSNSEPSPHAGFALLLGPTWSLTLNSSSTTLGRAVSDDKSRSRPTNRRTISSNTKSPASRFVSPQAKLSRAESASSVGFVSHTEALKGSPLYWISQWARQQPQSSLGSSEALFDNSSSLPSQPRATASHSYDSNQNGAITSDSTEGSGILNIASSSLPTHIVSSSTPLPQSTTISNGTNTGSFMDVDIPGDEKTQSKESKDLSPHRASSSSDSFHNDSTTEFDVSNISSSCEVDLGDDPTISRIHATIAYDAELCLWDVTCHSANGMFVNGRTVYPHDGPALLPSKSRLQIGSVLFFFLLPAAVPAASGNQSASSTFSSLTSQEEYIIEASIFESTLAPLNASSKKSSHDSARVSKKRRRNDRSIVLLKPLDAMEDAGKAKRKTFAQHVSKRNNSMRHILFGGTTSASSGLPEEEAEEEAWRRFLGMEKDSKEEQVGGKNAPRAYLKANYDPPLEEYRESDRHSKYAVGDIVPRGLKGAAAAAVAASASASTSTGDSSAFGGYADTAKSGGRGPRSNKPSEGTDASGTVFERPKLTYGQLIHLALESVPEKRMLFPEIAEYIEKTFPYFGTGAAGNWHNTVRQQLSHTSDFVRQERTNTSGKKGKGGFWALSHWYEGEHLLPRPK